MIDMEFVQDSNFQTPDVVIDYMVSLIKGRHKTVLEPTPGDFKIVYALIKADQIPIAPRGNYWDMEHADEKYDYVVMNPPFTPMEEAYKFLNEAMSRADNVIALMPWLTIINSQKRTERIFDFGLHTITHLPRNAFPGSRVQSCVLVMKRGYTGVTRFNHFNLSTGLTSDYRSYEDRRSLHITA